MATMTWAAMMMASPRTGFFFAFFSSGDSHRCYRPGFFFTTPTWVAPVHDVTIGKTPILTKALRERVRVKIGFPVSHRKIDLTGEINLKF